MEEDDDLHAIIVVAAVVGALQNVARNPVLQHTSVLTGQLYFAEVMETYNVHRFHEVARMDRAVVVPGSPDPGPSDGTYVLVDVW